MTFLKKHWQIAAALALIAFMFFFGWRLFGAAAKAIDLGVFVVLGVGLLLVPIASMGDEILPKLKEQATAVMNETTKGVASVSWPSPRTHRQELELAMVGRMGDLPLSDPALAGKHVKRMLDALEAQEAPPTAAPVDGILSSAGFGKASCGGCQKVDTIKLPVVDPGGPLPAPCQGKNCGTANGLGHSPDCLLEAAVIQGWTDAPEAIEAAIQIKGLTAPRVTKEDIEAEITHEHYFTAEQGARHPDAHNPRDHGDVTASLGRLTFCVLKLKNGFTVTGESACVSAENFDAQIGRDIARANAVEKMWLLMGFRLADKLSLNK